MGGGIGAQNPKSREQRAESREQRAESREQRAESTPPPLLTFCPSTFPAAPLACGRTLLDLLAVLSAALLSGRPRTGHGGDGPGGAGGTLQRDRRRDLDEQHELVDQRGPVEMARRHDKW